jgi:hypothetical protein
MSDAPHGSTTDVLALIDEIRSKSKRRDSDRFKHSEYVGLRSVGNRRKYRDSGCEFVRQGRNVVRKLSAREVAEFRAAVQRAIDAEPT